MARIIGGVGTTHVPSIGKAIADGKQSDPYWKPFFDGFPPVHRFIAREKPDVAAGFFNHHRRKFFLAKKPAFAIGAADEKPHQGGGGGAPGPHPPNSKQR